MMSNLYGSIDKSFEPKYSDEVESKISVITVIPKSSKNRYYYPLASVLSAIAFVIIVLVAYVQFPTSNSPSFIRYSTRKDADLSIVVSNEYGEATTTKYPYSFLATALFAETYKDNSMTISGTVSYCSYTYTISGVTDTTFSLSGEVIDSVFIFKPTVTGEYYLNVQETCYGVSSRTYSNTVWSKYVRRELSSLTDSDRESFLNAFKTLWEVSTVDGKAIYGDNYKGLYHFAVIHNDAGSSPVEECDEFHGNTGFINNHVMFGAYLEQSLQLVDPSVSLHYIAYISYFSSSAFKTHEENSLDGGTWTDLMTSKFFGSNDPVTGRILDGRWANLTVPYVTDAFLVSEDVSITSTFFPQEESKYFNLKSSAHTYSPYGLLRSPWNYNPSTYLARYNNVDRISDTSKIASWFYEGVTCSDYDSFITEMKGASFKTFLKDVEDDTHGYFHFTIAGTGGNYAQSINSQLRSDYGFDDSDIVVLDDSSHDFFKNYITWQTTYKNTANHTTLYLNCTNDAWDETTQTLKTTADPGTEDGPYCTCNSEVLGSSQLLAQMITILFADWITGNDDVRQEASTVQKVMSLSYDKQKAFVELLCGRYLIEGDLAGSGSAMDPLFWVAHGAVEKLFQKMVFENWLSDWTYEANYDGECSGHDSTGTKYWLKGFSFADKTVDASSLTNTEIINLLNPTTDLYKNNINFIYDHSDWSTICADEGIKLFSSD